MKETVKQAKLIVVLQFNVYKVYVQKGLNALMR